MASMNYLNTAMLDGLWLERPNKLLRFFSLAFCGVLLLTASAKISVPFIPVPMTMQTFAVLAICVAGGIRLGATTVLSYLLLGVLGMPVFAGGGGLAYVLGPTGGYLAGFLAAAVLLGYGVRKGYDRKNLPCAALMFGGILTIYLCGWLWLSTFLGLQNALKVGVLPFVAGDVFKTLLAVVSVRLLRSKTTKS